MRNKTLLASLAATLLGISGTCLAVDPLEPPPPPPPVKSGETLEPEVTIIDKGDKTIEEYSVNGRVYAVKISPKGGAPYFLIDNDGDGVLESRQTDIKANIQVPQWVIFSW